MNIPNSLTLLRIFFVPMLVAALVQERFGIDIWGIRLTHEWLGLAIFLCAAATDFVDGWLARRWRQVTTIGTLLDPIADKLLVSAALISLVQVRILPAYMAISDHRPRIRGLGSAQHRRRGRLHHQGQRSGQDQDGVAGGGHLVHVDRRGAAVVSHAGHGPDVDRGILRPTLGGELFFASSGAKWTSASRRAGAGN